MPTEVTEKWSARRGAYHAELYSWVSTRQYEVAYCPDELTARQAVAGIGITLNSAHPLNAHLKCTSIIPEPTGFNFYTVTVQWTIPVGGDATSSDDPLAQPIKIGWDPMSYSEPSEVDAYSQVMLNTAGDPFDPPPNMDWPMDVLVVKKFMPYFDVVQATKYRGAINYDQFTIASNPQAIVVPQGQCRCVSIKPMGDFTLNADFVEVCYRFAFRPNNTDLSNIPGDAWDIRILNQGYQGWYNDGGTIKQDKFWRNGAEVSEPVLLKADGTPVRSGITVVGHPPVANPNAPTATTNLPTPGTNTAVIETQTYGTESCTFLHFYRGKWLPFTGLV